MARPTPLTQKIAQRIHRCFEVTICDIKMEELQDIAA